MPANTPFDYIEIVRAAEAAQSAFDQLRDAHGFDERMAAITAHGKAVGRLHEIAGAQRVAVCDCALARGTA